MKVYRRLRVFIGGFIIRPFILLSIPISTFVILGSSNIHTSYRMSILRKFRLGFKMYLNTRRIQTGTSYRAHLAIALKMLETSPNVPGDVIECGTWKGGSAANLSLVCRIVGRKLKVYDSFEGLPEPESGERIARAASKGGFAGTLGEVKSNVRRYGAIECCEFIEGWFKDTLPRLDSPVLLAFLDVDFESSLHTCVRHIWPNLVDEGYMFTDESIMTDYVALFYSERWWEKYFNRTPPGLVGAGSGLPLGQYYIGPFLLGPKFEWDERHPHQHPIPIAYTKKTMSGYWAYYPEDDIR